MIIKNAEEKSFIQRKRNKVEEVKEKNESDDEHDNMLPSHKKRKIQEKDGNIKAIQVRERPEQVTQAYPTHTHQAKNQVQSHSIKFSGSEYSGKYGKGDLLIKNKPEPFAYIQLNPKATSKKRRGQTVKVFEQVMNQKGGSSIIN